MFVVPGMQEVHQHSQVCQFDMCTAGDLKDPTNGLHMKKGMSIITTFPSLYQRLHGLTCHHNHNHQTLEGTITYQGSRINRTQFSDHRKFARMVAQVLCKTNWERPFNWQPACRLQPGLEAKPSDPSLAVSVIRPRAKPKFTPTELVSPRPASESEVKRRRLSGKQGTSQSLEGFQNVLSKICKVLPRVGKTEIKDPPLIYQLQQLFPDKEIVRVVACRGTDRTMSPPDRMSPAEAPFRKSLLIQRHTGEIRYELHCRTQLSNRQLVRPNHSCKVNVTMFSREIPRNTTTEFPLPTDPMSVPVEPSTPLPDDSPMPETTKQSGPQPTSVPVVERSEPPLLTDESNAPEGETVPTFEQMDESPKWSRMQALPKWEQHQVMKMHRNLGHSSNNRLSKALQIAGHVQRWCKPPWSCVVPPVHPWRLQNTRGQRR